MLYFTLYALRLILSCCLRFFWRLMWPILAEGDLLCGARNRAHKSVCISNNTTVTWDPDDRDTELDDVALVDEVLEFLKHGFSSGWVLASWRLPDARAAK